MQLNCFLFDSHMVNPEVSDLHLPEPSCQCFSVFNAHKTRKTIGDYLMQGFVVIL